MVVVGGERVLMSEVPLYIDIGVKCRAIRSTLLGLCLGAMDGKYLG